MRITVSFLTVIVTCATFWSCGPRMVLGQKDNVITSFFVDPQVILVPKWEGWGTSLAWFADLLGGWNEEIFTNITTALFHKDHLNLNIVRYVIGGTTPGPNGHGCPNNPTYRPGAASESFKDSADGEYLWTRDGRQIKVLLEAQRLGVDTFEAFSNSPPQWMTISGCSKGNPWGLGLLHNNLRAEQAPAFAEYAADVIEHFHTNLGVTFTSYAPFNEPSGVLQIGGWFPFVSTQEGCNMNRNVMVAVVKAVRDKLTSKGMDYVKLTTADETQVNEAIMSQRYFKRMNVSKFIEKVNVHGYWDYDRQINRRDILYINTRKDGHRLWMNEMGWASSPLNNMDQALNIARRIVRELRDMMPSAWLYWQTMEVYGPGQTGAWGLIDVLYDQATVPDPSLTQMHYRSGYYGFAQFTKFIKKGYSIIEVTNQDALAAYDSATETLVIVVVNWRDIGTYTYTYDLSLFQSIGSVQGVRTSSTEQLGDVSNSEFQVGNKVLTYAPPAKSITTFVIQSSKLDTRESELLSNGDFESGVMPPWSKTASGLASKVMTLNGNFSGRIEQSAKDRTVQQFVYAPETGRYYLSAKVTTSGMGTALRVSVQGVKRYERTVTLYGYRPYGIAFEANKGDLIRVYVSAPQIISDTFIDDVTLHYIKGLSTNDQGKGGSNGMSASISITISTCFILVSLIKNFVTFIPQ